MDEYKKFAKDIATVGINDIALKLKPLILVPILTKTLGTAGYGILTQILLLITLVVPFATLGLNHSMVKFLPEKKKADEVCEFFYSILTAIFLFSIIIGLTFVMGSDFISEEIMKSPESSKLIKLASIIMVFWSLDLVSLNYFRSRIQMKTYSLIGISHTLLEILLMTLFLLLGYGLLGVILAILIIRFVQFLALIFLIMRQIGIMIPKFKNLAYYVKFGAPLIPGILFAWILHSSDRFIIGFFKGPSLVGVYSIAYTLSTVAIFFLGPLSIVLYPTISKLWSEGKTEKVKSYISYSIRYFLFLSIPSVIGLYFLADQIILTLSTPEFVSGGNVIIFLAFGSLLYGIYLILSYILTLAEKTTVLGLILVSSGLLNIALNILMVPRYGITGAAVSTLITYLVLTLMVTYNVRKYIRFKFDGIFILKSVVASAIMITVPMTLSPADMVGLITTILLSSVLYFVAMVVLGAVTKREYHLLRALLSRN